MVRYKLKKWIRRTLFYVLLFGIIITLNLGIDVSGLSTGATNGETFVNSSISGGANWNDPALALSSNNLYATSFLLATQTSNQLNVTEFYFNGGNGIPNGTKIDGIKVEIERKANLAQFECCIQDNSIRLLRMNTSVGENKANTSFWGTIDQYVTYGNETDLWGYGWTPDDISTFSFGVAISVIAPDTDVTASIDHVRITVYYTQDVPYFENGYPQINSTNNGINNTYSDFTVVWKSIDNDNATLRYNITWYTNNRTNFTLPNIAYTNNTLNVDRLNVKNLTFNQTWKAMISVFDGKNINRTNTSEILIILDFNPTFNITNEFEYGINDTFSNITINWSFSNPEALKLLSNWYEDNQSLMIANIPFETNNSNTVFDISGYGRHGYFDSSGGGNNQNNVSCGVPGFQGLACSFDSLGDNITLQAFNFTNSGQFTIEAWVYDYGSQTGNIIMDIRGLTLGQSQNEDVIRIAKRCAVVERGLEMGWGLDAFVKDRTELILNVRGDVACVDNTKNVYFPNNTWQYVALTYGSNSLSLYWNGTNYGSSIGGLGLADTSLNITIGNREKTNELGNPLPRGWFGKIDNVRIWNRTLSPEQIQENYLADLENRSINLLTYHDLDRLIQGEDYSNATYHSQLVLAYQNTLSSYKNTTPLPPIIRNPCTYKSNTNYIVQLYNNCTVINTLNLNGNNVIVNGSTGGRFTITNGGFLKRVRDFIFYPCIGLSNICEIFVNTAVSGDKIIHN